MKSLILLAILTYSAAAPSQTFKGHHIGESVAEFFNAQPDLQAKLTNCLDDKPRELTEPEIKARYGAKVLKEYEKRRTDEGPNATAHTAIMDTDPDVYGDRCAALVDFAQTGQGRMEGTGYLHGNKYEQNLTKRTTSSGVSLATLNAESELFKQQSLTREWAGIDPEHRTFLFSEGKLQSFSLTVFAPYADIVEDVTSKVNAKSVELLTPMHNAYGATWSDPMTTWDTKEIHVSLTESRNPAEHNSPRLAVQTEAEYLQFVERQRHRPSSVD